MRKDIIKISNTAAQAKYRQIIDSIVGSLRNGNLKQGDKVPSVNDIAHAHNLSRDTVLLAYNELKSRGVLRSVPGKGYYVETSRVDLNFRILLLFDEFNAFKEDLYTSFVKNLAGKAEVDIYFHHFNEKIFDAILQQYRGQYTSYVIMPALLPNAHLSIKRLPDDKVFILDQLPDELKGLYPAIFQSFADDIYNGLRHGIDLLRKYKRLVLVYPGGKEPIGFYNGFTRFCDEFNFDYDVIAGLTERDIHLHNVYIMPNDRDLVFLVKHSQTRNYEIGSEVGVISLNDYGLKEIVGNGITTISTDFNAMGEKLAWMILNNRKEVIKNSSRLIVRGSL